MNCVTVDSYLGVRRPLQCNPVPSSPKDVHGEISPFRPQTLISRLLALIFTSFLTLTLSPDRSLTLLNSLFTQMLGAQSLVHGQT